MKDDLVTIRINKSQAERLKFLVNMEIELGGDSFDNDELEEEEDGIMHDLRSILQAVKDGEKSKVPSRIVPAVKGSGS